MDFSIQTESEGWEALLEKHRTKAQELERWTCLLWLTIIAVLMECCVYIFIYVFFFREVERGMQMGVPLDSTSVAQSSQYHLIQNKPDYHTLLRRQLPLLNTVSLIVCWTSDFYVKKNNKIHKNANFF